MRKICTNCSREYEAGVKGGRSTRCLNCREIKAQERRLQKQEELKESLHIKRRALGLKPVLVGDKRPTLGTGISGEIGVKGSKFA